MKRAIASLGLAVLLVSPVLLSAPQAQAAALTAPQVSAIIGLLRAFNVDETTIAVVYAQLAPATTTATTSPAVVPTTQLTPIAPSTPAAGSAIIETPMLQVEVWSKTISDQGYKDGDNAATSTLRVVTNNQLDTTKLDFSSEVTSRWDKKNEPANWCITLYNPRRTVCNGYYNDITLLSPLTPGMTVTLTDVHGTSVTVPVQ